MYNNVLVKANDNHIKTVLLQGTPVAKEYMLLDSNPCMTSMSKMQRFDGAYSAETQTVLKQIAASALNTITRPYPCESP